MDGLPCLYGIYLELDNMALSMLFLIKRYRLCLSVLVPPLVLSDQIYYVGRGHQELQPL